VLINPNLFMSVASVMFINDRNLTLLSNETLQADCVRSHTQERVGPEEGSCRNSNAFEAQRRLRKFLRRARNSWQNSAGAVEKLFLVRTSGHLVAVH
jgi:hypothetical protein